jgi:hypothetical protein
MPVKNLTYQSADNGNCRVYYRSGRALFAFQNETSWGRVQWSLYRCSQDGEPSYRVNPENIGDVEFPKGDERIEDELRQFMVSPAWRTLNEEVA